MAPWLPTFGLWLPTFGPAPDFSVPGSRLWGSAPGFSARLPAGSRLLVRLPTFSVWLPTFRPAPGFQPLAPDFWAWLPTLAVWLPTLPPGSRLWGLWLPTFGSGSRIFGAAPDFAGCWARCATDFYDFSFRMMKYIICVQINIYAKILYVFWRCGIPCPNMLFDLSRSILKLIREPLFQFCRPSGPLSAIEPISHQ